MKHKQPVALGFVLAVGVVGCGGDDAAHGGTLPWNQGKTQVVNGDRSVTEVASPGDDGCLKVGEEFADPKNCIKVDEVCEGAADVLLSDEGKVLESICYPQEGSISVAQIQAQDGGIAQNQNNAVIVLSGDAEVDLGGDLDIDANNVILYGDGPNTSVLDGNLTIDGNNSVVRGVRITGDVTVVKNNTTFFLCVIEGDVTIEANNTVIAGCDILGSLTIRGQNTRLVGNHLVSAPEGQADCEENRKAEDTNQNGSLEPTELGAPLEC